VNVSNHKGDYEYVICSKCGLSFLCPYPSEFAINSFYNIISGHEHYHQDFESLSSKLLYYLIYRTIKNILYNRSPKISLLDIGCGTGMLLKYMQIKKIDVHGVELSRFAAEKCMLRVGRDRVLNCHYRDLNNFKNQFDVVLLYCVLEHVYDPDELISISYDLLKSGGLLVVEVPNLDSYSLRKYKEYENGIKTNAPEHVTIWSKKTLVALLKEHNFKISKIKNTLNAPLNYSRTLINKYNGKRIVFYISTIFSIILTIYCYIAGGSNSIQLYATKKND